MIKVNELRVGNWVTYDDGGILFKVKDINTTTPVGIGVINADEETWIELEYFSPIPLTPEILEKAGFVKVDYYYQIILFYKTDFLEIDDNFDLWIMSPFNQRIKLPSIEYLHQLQNLYFALTGEELSIEL